MDARPKARTDGVLSERIDDEVVVYDQMTQTAHCLSAEAASVWEQCHGDLSMAEIADRIAVSPEVVERAVDALHDCGLLDDGPGPVDDDKASDRDFSRREATLKLARLGGAVFVAPLIYSAAVGSARAAGSMIGFPKCGTFQACTTNGTNLPVGTGLTSAQCNSTGALCGNTKACPNFVNPSCCYGICASTSSVSCGGSNPAFVCSTQYNCALSGQNCPNTTASGCGPGGSGAGMTGSGPCCPGNVMCGGRGTLFRPNVSSGNVSNWGCCSGTCNATTNNCT
jgi:hypothetical protein